MKMFHSRKLLVPGLPCCPSWQVSRRAPCPATTAESKVIRLANSQMTLEIDVEVHSHLSTKDVGRTIVKCFTEAREKVLYCSYLAATCHHFPIICPQISPISLWHSWSSTVKPGNGTQLSPQGALPVMAKPACAQPANFPMMSSLAGPMPTASKHLASDFQLPDAAKCCQHAHVKYVKLHGQKL